MRSAIAETMHLGWVRYECDKLSELPAGNFTASNFQALLSGGGARGETPSDTSQINIFVNQ